jgi:hypothetical protein
MALHDDPRPPIVEQRLELVAHLERDTGVSRGPVVVHAVNVTTATSPRRHRGDRLDAATADQVRRVFRRVA